MALRWAPKTKTEVVQRIIDWSGILNTDEIDTYTLDLTQGTVTFTTSQDDKTIVVDLASGLDGGLIFKASINTLAGKTYEQLVVMEIRPADVDTLPTLPSTSTKQTIINMAYEQASLSGYEFDHTPEEVISALRQLDAMMAQWASESIDLSYNFPPVFGEGDPADTSGIPDFAIMPAAISLALLIAPGIGKTMSSEARTTLIKGMTAIRAATATIPTRLLQRGTPRGQGQKPWSTWYPFINEVRP